MRNFKALVATSLACVLDVSVVYGGDCENDYGGTACFKYWSASILSKDLKMSKKEGWTSYKKLTSGANTFGSLDNFDGQYVPKLELDTTHLGISLESSTLILSDTRRVLGLKFPFQVGLHIDIGNGGGKEDVLNLYSSKSATLGNIVVTNSAKNGSKKNQKISARKDSVTLEFKKNGKVNYQDTTELQLGSSAEVRAKFKNITQYNKDVPWALIGGIWNDSGKKVSATFDDGARMMGDIYTRGEATETNLVFGNQSVRGNVSKLFGFVSTNENREFSNVFMGGVRSENGGVTYLRIEDGDGVLESVGFGGVGLVANSGGKNSIYIGSKTPSNTSQSLFVDSMVANGGDEVLSENGVVFDNGFPIGNVMIVGSIVAEFGKNGIFTQGGKMSSNWGFSWDTKLDLEVGDKILTSSSKIGKNHQDDVGNTIMIDGKVSVGNRVLFSKLLDSHSFGLVALGGKNTIVLADIDKNDDNRIVKRKKGDEYGFGRTLATPQIFASGNGVNDIDIGGNLWLLFCQNGGNVIGGSIFAENGGKNKIIVNGVFMAMGIHKPSDVALSSRVFDISDNEKTPLDFKETIKSTSIIVSGNSIDSKNEIVIKNMGKDRLYDNSWSGIYLGGIFAYGGTNHVVLHNNGGKSWVENVFAGKIDHEGRQNIGGVNEIFVIGGGETTIENLATEAGGANHFYFLRKLNGGISQKNRVNITNLTYGNGGMTSIAFGDMSYENILTEETIAINNRVRLFLKKDKGTENASLLVGSGIIHSLDKMSSNGNDVTLGVFSGTFFGSVETSSKTHYYLGDGSTFLGSIGAYNDSSRSDNNATLTLKSKSKFILKNEGATHFGTLILTQSSSPDDNLLQDTIKLPRTTLDLATNGESFSQFLRRNQGRTLDVETMVVDTSGGDSSPLLRLFVAGAEGGQVDNVKVGSFKGGSLSDDTLQYRLDSSNGSIMLKKIDKGGTSLDTQVFLPTHLIGTDFTGKGVTILSVANGGGDLQVTSRKAQTGFTTYWVEITKEEIDKSSRSNGNGDSGVNESNGGQTTSTLVLANQASSSSSLVVTSTPPTTLVASSTSQNSSKSHRWVLGKTIDASINKDSLSLAGSILANNHSTWTMMLNSLNKRMGELRNNPNTHGVWGRIFGGEQISSHGYAKIDSGYVTLQAGYDYAFFTPSSWGEATLYVGGALSYGFMSSKSQEFMGKDLLYAPYAYNAYSHSLELGIYAVYLYDCGLYLDSIVKFGFITTDFRGINEHSSQANITNYHITLGEEMGYRFSFGGNKEWIVTPQVEIIFGYLSETEAKQEYDGQTLHSILEGVSTLRTRVGSDFGYALKYKNQTYDFRVGVSYEVDYANADASYGILGANYLHRVRESALISTDQRMVLDLGVNVFLCENVRLYTNFESSFFGKVNTKYEANFGIRYSFGERKLSTAPKERINLPVRVEGE